MGMIFKPYPKQQEAIDFILRVKKGLLNMEMGAGKSPVSMAAASQTNQKVSIFSPPFLVKNWEKEIDKFGFGNKFPYEIIKTSTLRGNLYSNAVWIIDEAHQFKNVKAQRTKNLFALMKKHKPEFVFLLTGTPLLRSGEDLYTTFLICNRKKEFENYHHYPTFKETFTQQENLRLGSRSVKRYFGIKNAEFLRDMISPFTMTAKLSDIVSIGDFVDCFFDADLGRFWEQRMGRAYFSYENSGSISEEKVECALSKIIHTVNYVERIYEENKTPILIFSDHVEPAIQMGKILNAPVITGKVPAAERMEIVEDFKSGNKSFLVATIGSAGIGLSLDNCNDVVFNDISWTHGFNEQAAARIRRATSSGILRRHYVLGGRIDELILEKVKMKEAASNSLFGG
jgi:superfamily II DNA or RNA helicase